MTERLHRGYANAAKTKTGGGESSGGSGLGPKKTMFVLVVVVGCFAVLWPKVFYPMLADSASHHIKPSSIDRTTGCCDVISEKDMNTIKIMSELCSTIIQKEQDSSLTGREIVAKCSAAVLETCGIDISAVLQEKVRLGQTTRQILDQVRSMNGSLCLKYNFGMDPWRLGVPHRVNAKASPPYTVRQERPIHLRSELVHPAFRERGSAIPHTHRPSPSPSRPSPSKVLPGRPGPIPAMRPTMGGPGHMVPPPKHATGTMGLIMPVYTIAIVIFFTYTVMKIVFRKQPESLYPDITPDPVFRKEVFQSSRCRMGSRVTKNDASSKLVVNAVSALLDEVDHEIASRHKAASQFADQDVVANGNVPNQEEEQPSVKVLGMETRASCEGGKKWSRSGSPALPTPHPVVQEPAEPPQEIYLEGSLPPQSHHLLVSDAATETQKMNSEEDPAIVLAGKMTLSVISLDSSENGTDKSSDSDKKTEDRSSSNVSEDFEKIEVDIDEQINSIIEQAQEMALDQDLLDEIKKELNEIGVEKSTPLIIDKFEENLDGIEEYVAHETDVPKYEEVQVVETGNKDEHLDKTNVDNVTEEQSSETKTNSDSTSMFEASEIEAAIIADDFNLIEVDETVLVSTEEVAHEALEMFADSEIEADKQQVTDDSRTVNGSIMEGATQECTEEDKTEANADIAKNETEKEENSEFSPTEAEQIQLDNKEDLVVAEIYKTSSEQSELDKLNAAIADLGSEFRPKPTTDSVTEAFLQSESQAANTEEPEDEEEEEDDEEEVEYEYEESDNEDIDDEIRNVGRLEGREELQLNGHTPEQAKNGLNGSCSVEDLTDDEHLINDDEEVEEIIEYVTDEEEEVEEEEEIEPDHRNNINHLNENAEPTS